MPDTAHPDAMPPNDWNAAFAALPLETPPADGWSRLSGALDARAAMPAPRHRRNRWLALAAVLATVALIPLLLMRERATSTPASSTPATTASIQPDAVSRTSTTRIAAATPSFASTPIDTGAPTTNATAVTSTRQGDVAKVSPNRTAVRPTAKRSASPAPPTPSPSADELARPGNTVDAIASNVDTAATGLDASNDRTDTLMQLQAESARLEALIAMTRDDRVGSAAATVMTAELDQRIGLIDAGLTQNALPADQRDALWRERVQTLRDLAGVETTQLWLAAQGQSYDGALVSVD